MGMDTLRRPNIFVILKFSALVLLTLVAALAFVLVVGSEDATAVVEYTNNDDSDNAIWLEPPVSLNEVHMWERSGSNDNDDDWWMFNASPGQHVQINFRKMHIYNNPPPPFIGGTYRLNYMVYDSGLNEIYHYWRDYEENDRYRRDMWSYIVPENEANKHYIRVWITTNQNREAYYWLNVTVEDPRDLNAASQYSGVLDVNSSFTADYNPVDYYKVNLGVGAQTADFVTLDFHKEEADVDLILEVWEAIPFGNGENQHMLNRTTNFVANDLTVRFLATYTGTYFVRMARDFWDVGSSEYTLTITFGTRAPDADALAEDGTEIKYIQKLRGQSIEMGYDTHDWYRVQVQKGDTIFKVTVDILDPNVDSGQGYELVVYNGTGRLLWAESSVGMGPSYGDAITLPPTGTTTIFDFNQTLYVRFSADAGVTARTIRGFRSLYDIEFVLQNRPPVLIEPFNDTYEWDEDGGISIELDSHFFDPDGDEVTYTFHNRTVLSYDNAALSFQGYANLTSPPNWHGTVTWRLRVVDKGQTDPSHVIYIDFPFIVHSVPDLPIANETLVRQCDEEEGPLSVDLRKLFYDVDDGPGGVLTFAYEDDGQTDVAVTLDEATGALELTPGTDVSGTFTFEFSCTDDQEVPVTGTVELHVIGVNDIPRILAEIPPVHMVEGGDPVEVDLDSYFYDVDGDALRYTFVVPSSVSGDMNVYHKNNVVTESIIVIELTDPYFYATVTVKVTCLDTEDTLVKQDLVIVVANVPNPPILEVSPVGNPGDIPEGTSKTFEVTDVDDPDVPEFGLHTYAWYVDDVLVEDFNQSAFVYSPGFTDAGPHSIKVVVTDPAGLGPLSDPTWAFLVTDVNREPTVTFVQDPPDVAKETDKLTVELRVEDPDGDSVEIYWYRLGNLEDKLLGTGTSVSFKLPPGKQTVEIVVDDGKGDPTTTTFTVTVEKVEEGGGGSMLLILILLVVIIAVVVVVAVVAKSRKPPEIEAKMDLESLQQDYDPSQGRGGASGDAYDPTPKDYDSYEELKP